MQKAEASQGLVISSYA